jgi:hypothetical protein
LAECDRIRGGCEGWGFWIYLHETWARLFPCR